MSRRFAYMVGIAVALALVPAQVSYAYQIDFAQDVAAGYAGAADPSPRDVNGSSLQQYGVDENGNRIPNSQIDNYVYQNDQINLEKNSGTVKVLRVNQKALINDYVTAIVELKNANVRELRGLAQDICRKEGGNADVLQDKEGKQFYLAVVCPAFQLPYIKKTLSAVDKDWVKEVNNGSWYTYYTGKNRDVRNVMNSLQYYRSPDGTWRFDDANNAVEFFDQPNVAPLFKWGMEQIDIPPSMLALNVAIYEVDTQNDLDLGFDFEACKNSPAGQQLFGATLWGISGKDAIDLFPGSGPFSVVKSGSRFAYNIMATTAYLDFLQAKGKARLLTKGDISAKNGTPAELAAVDQVVSFNTSVGGPTNLNVASPSLRDDDDKTPPDVTLRVFNDRLLQYRNSGKVGVYMLAVPVIGTDSGELSVALEVSDVTGATPSGSPIIERRFFSSKLEVKDGQPIVLSGIKRSADVKTGSGIPWLRDIKYLGYLFGREVSTKSEKDIVVILTPRFKFCPVSTAEPPKEVKTAIALAQGQEKIPVPPTCFCFDQWLLDQEK